MNKISTIISEDNIIKYKIYSNFDSGSLKDVKYSNNIFNLTASNDLNINNKEGKSCSWFYFKLKYLKINRIYTFIINKITILKKLLVL